MSNDRYAKINSQRVEFDDLKNGDEFELFEPDNDELIGVFKATSNVYINKNGISEIDCDLAVTAGA